MVATIIKIHPPKEGQQFSVSFQRVEFRTEGGRWAKTDLCPGYRNFANWRAHLRPGAVLSNLREKSPGTIDADSIPHFLRQEPSAATAAPPRVRPQPKPEPQMELFK